MQLTFFFNTDFFSVFVVKNLLKAIPLLEGKISEVENLTSQFSPISNISEDIKKIKELIEQARDAANRVRSHTQMYSILCVVLWQVSILYTCSTQLDLYAA